LFEGIRAHNSRVKPYKGGYAEGIAVCEGWILMAHATYNNLFTLKIKQLSFKFSGLFCIFVV
jgi:hypothetical protein